jgi:hypothetical protein
MPESVFLSKNEAFINAKTWKLNKISIGVFYPKLIDNQPMKFEHCGPNGPETTIFSVKIIVTLTFDPKINRGHVLDMAVHPIKFYSCRLINA